MDNNLKYFLENTVVTKDIIKTRINHPITRVPYPSRMVYVLLKKYANDFLKLGTEPRFISLAGLRGVGKTTLLWQIADYMMLNPDVKDRIYFFNVNTLKTLGIDLYIALEEFQRHILHKKFSELDEPIILFFDEVHDDDNWSKTLKILYDEAKTAFIMCTGSSALLLNQTADLARRMRIEKIFPFKFTEFVLAKTYMENREKIYPEKDLAKLLKEALFFSENIQDVSLKLNNCSIQVNSYFNKIQLLKLKIDDLRQGYVNYQNIPNFLFFREKSTINDSILDLFKRVILEDIPKINVQYTDYLKIERLILRLAGSDEINPEKLASDIGIKVVEINELVDILAKAELINVLLPFGNINTRITKNKKAFFMSPSLRRALLSNIYGQNLPEHFGSKLLEDTVVMYLKRILPEGIISYTTGSTEHNPDFVIETRDKAIIMEVGTSKSSAKQIKNSRISYRYGILVTNGIKNPEIIDDIVYLPFNWFLLL